MSLINPLRGTGVALITPFDKKQAVDFDALGRVIEHVISGGVEYVVTLGTTGETPTISKTEKAEIIEYTMDAVSGRVPVVVGVGGNDTRAVVAELETLPLQQAIAVLSASPYYNKPTQEGIFRHYEVLASASPKPIILYNVPGRTGRNMNASTTLRLAREVPNIAGIKEASGDMAQCMQLLKERPEQFLVVSGDDALALPQIACGMDGIISVAANAFPEAFTQLVRSALLGDFKKARTFNDGLLEAYDLMFTENNPAGVKAFMSEMGLIANHLRLPMVPVTPSTLEKIQAFMQRAKKKPDYAFQTL